MITQTRIRPAVAYAYPFSRYPYGRCMARGCTLGAYYRTARTGFCAVDWRRAVLAYYAEGQHTAQIQLLYQADDSTSLFEWLRFVCAASDAEIKQAYHALALREEGL